MKKKGSAKKNIGGFAPELHWDLILMSMAVIVIVIAGYFGFVYITLNNHIQNIASENAGSDTTTTKDEQALKKIVNMESVIARYRERDQAYHDLLKAMAGRVQAPVVVATTSTSSVASTTVR